MLPEADPTSTIWTIATLIILLGMIPAILFLLGRAASAGTPPDLEQMDSVRELAVQFNEAAELLLTEATRAFVGSPGERHALDALIRLADSAENFRLALFHPVRSASRLRRVFRSLAADYHYARMAFPALRAYRTGLDRMEKLEKLMTELKVLYDIRPGSSADSRPSLTAP